MQNKKSAKNEEQAIMKRRTFISKMNKKVWRFIWLGFGLD